MVEGEEQRYFGTECFSAPPFFGALFKRVQRLKSHWRHFSQESKCDFLCVLDVNNDISWFFDVKHVDFPLTMWRTLLSFGVNPPG